MDKILVQGGRRLKGEVTISGAKNAALPMLAATLLCDGINRLSNVPDLRDIRSTLDLLTHLGVRCEMKEHTIEADASGLNNHEAPYDLVRKMRASILVLGPLLARLKKARVSLPGGCAIGARPINLHLSALARLGAEIKLEHGYVEAACPKLRGADIDFDVVTVTGTENVMMAAALAEGTTILRNAAREPEVTALAEMLNRMGARIHGAGSTEITIHGVERLHPAEVNIIPDRIETGTFMIAAALTGGDVTIVGAEAEHVKALMAKLRRVGASIDLLPEKRIRIQGHGTPVSVDVKTMPYPGFPTDMQAQFMVLMAVAKGSCLISETIFENRFIHVGELRRMGADITVSGNNAVVKGVPHLSGAPVMATDLRASACLILAGLVADKTTIVNRVYHLDRGYEALEKKFENLGAAIRRVRS
jgi:UDP-N-acetylglucosamine 1-carboxyvinyltransferase